MTEETPKRPYPNLKWYSNSSGNMTIREAEAGLNNCLAEIKKLRAALRGIADHHIPGIIPDGHNMYSWAIYNYCVVRLIARAALGEKDNGND